ncbi:MAG: hypothetical protein ABH951_02350 [Patescibacteria group bacterium]
MTEKLKQKTKELLESKPKEVQEAVSSFDWDKNSEEIGKKYFLTESEINALQIQIMLILTGLVDIYYFKTNIENYVGISKEEAEKITNEISEDIFKPISEKIIENIKNNVKNITGNWKQNLNFIISDGNYMALIKREDIKEKMVDTPQIPKVPINHSKIEDMKSKFTI